MRMTLGEIAALVNGEVHGNAELSVCGVAPLDSAGRDELTFAEKGPGLKHIEASGAAAVLVPEGQYRTAKPLVVVGNPRLAFAKLSAAFNPGTRPATGIHPSAVLGKGCSIGNDISIAAGVVIGENTVVGDRVVLHPNVVIGSDVSIGEDTMIHPLAAVLDRCKIGARVIIHAGTVIGSDGFGFVHDGGCHVKVPQTGIVRIDDDVEIGANNTIDRATFGETWIKRGVKTDNQVHIAHNVVVGEHSLLIAQVGIAGSTRIGHHVIIAGQAGIADHVEIGNQVMVGGGTGVVQSIPDKQIVSGAILAMPHRTWRRMNKVLPHLPDMQKRIRFLEERLRQLEENKKESGTS